MFFINYWIVDAKKKIVAKGHIMRNVSIHMSHSAKKISLQRLLIINQNV